MTNDEVIEILKYIKARKADPDNNENEALDLAIENLKEQRPTVRFHYKGKNIADMDLYSCMGCGETMCFWDDAVPKYCSFCGAKGEVNHGL